MKRIIISNGKKYTVNVPSYDTQTIGAGDDYGIYPGTSSLTSSGFVPHAPVLLASTDAFTTDRGDGLSDDNIVYYNGYLYLFNATSYTFYTLDVTDPTSISVVGSTVLVYPPSFLKPSGSYIYGLTFRGDGSGNDGDAYLVSVNISNPAAPEEVADVAPQFPGETYPWEWVELKGKYLYCPTHFPGGGQGRILVYDVSTGSAPTYVTSVLYPDNSWGGGALVISGSYMYANDYFSAYSRPDTRQSFHTINISNPASPFVVTTSYAPQTTADPAPFDPWTNWVDGNKLYISDDAFVQVYNITTPSAPHYVTESYFGTIGTDIEGRVTIPNYAFMSMMQGSPLVTLKLDTFTATNITDLGGSGTNYATSMTIDPTNRRIFLIFDAILHIYSY